MLEHARLVLDGRVSPLLLWEKHPASCWCAAVAVALMLLLILKRLLFGARPQDRRAADGAARAGPRR